MEHSLGFGQESNSDVFGSFLKAIITVKRLLLRSREKPIYTKIDNLEFVAKKKEVEEPQHFVGTCTHVHGFFYLSRLYYFALQPNPFQDLTPDLY